jgi:hypothetical protein
VDQPSGGGPVHPLRRWQAFASPVVGDATAKTHVSHLLQKLALRDRIHAVVFAYDSGVITPVGEQRDAALPSKD